MRLLSKLLAVALLSMASRNAGAQSLSSMHLLSPAYEAEAAKLRAAPSQQCDFSQAVLSDVLRVLAMEAGISFFSLPDDSPEGSRLVTFSINASPFRVLETLCASNQLAIIPDNGIWYIRPADDKELIGKAYEVRHNALERVERANGSSGSSGGGMSMPTSGSAGTGGVNLQGNQETFLVRRSEVINAIRSLLGLPPEEMEMAQTGGPGALSEGLQGAAAMAGDSQTKAMNSNELSAFRKPKVIWMSDSNTLYVVATRLQHMWVEGYLEAADKPQTLIALEVKFIETSRDPSKELGIDWTGTLGSGGTYRQVTKAEVTKNDFDQPTVKYDYEMQPTTGGFRVDASQLLTAGNVGNLAGTLGWPALGVLSAQDLNVKLRALLRDEETKTVSYPRMVTLNNREVSIRSVVNQPVLGSSASATVGAGATTTQSISYLPIGTVLNILPKRMDGDKILLNMAVTVSSIIGNEIIGGNPYPIASSRVYSAPVEIDSGYTVAVGGLDEAREREGKAGVPVLQSIPGLGKLFKYDSKSKNHKNLMLFITPNIIIARDGGLPDEPQSVVPQRPNQYQPKIPKVDSGSGTLIGGPGALPNAVAYLQKECDVLENTIKESRITPEESRKLKELKVAVGQLHAQCDGLKLQYPDKFNMIDSYQVQLLALITRTENLAKLLFSKKYF